MGAAAYPVFQVHQVPDAAERFSLHEAVQCLLKCWFVGSKNFGSKYICDLSDDSSDHSGNGFWGNSNRNAELAEVFSPEVLQLREHMLAVVEWRTVNRAEQKLYTRKGCVVAYHVAPVRRMIIETDYYSISAKTKHSQSIQ